MDGSGRRGARVAGVTSAHALGFALQGYEGAAAAWADGAELAFGPLADALLARAPALAGRVVLDVGAGTERSRVGTWPRGLSISPSTPLGRCWLMAHRPVHRP